MKAIYVSVAVSLTAIFLVAAASASGNGLSKAEYLAKLRYVNAASSRADDAAMTALQSKSTTASQVKAKFFAMGAEHVRVGHLLAAIKPPTSAMKANANLAHAEVVFGQQNEAIANRLPATKSAILKYVQSLKPPSGGKLLDRAIAELHAAGFKV